MLLHIALSRPYTTIYTTHKAIKVFELRSVFSPVISLARVFMASGAGQVMKCKCVMDDVVDFA